MTSSPHTDLRCAREGCGHDAKRHAHRPDLPDRFFYCNDRDCECIEFVAPQAPEAPRAPMCPKCGHAPHAEHCTVMAWVEGEQWECACSEFSGRGDAETTPAPTKWRDTVAEAMPADQVTVVVHGSEYDRLKAQRVAIEARRAASLDSGPRAEPTPDCDGCGRMHSREWCPKKFAASELCAECGFPPAAPIHGKGIGITHTWQQPTAATPAEPASEPTMDKCEWTASKPSAHYSHVVEGSFVPNSVDNALRHLRAKLPLETASWNCVDTELTILRRDLATQGRSLAALRSAATGALEAIKEAMHLDEEQHTVVLTRLRRTFAEIKFNG